MKSSRLFKKIISSQDGFGMIELLVTIIILSIGIFSLISLMGKLVQADRFNTIDLISLNLAREGVEVVRNIRDSNWLSGQPWETSLAQGNDYTAILKFDDATEQWSLDFSIDDISGEEVRLYIDPVTHLYSHNESGETTSYKRLLVLDPVCYDDVTQQKHVRESGTFCLGNEQKIGIRVTSWVRWQDVGASNFRDKKIVNTIFNWR